MRRTESLRRIEKDGVQRWEKICKYICFTYEEISHAVKFLSVGGGIIVIYFQLVVIYSIGFVFVLNWDLSSLLIIFRVPCLEFDDAFV